MALLAAVGAAGAQTQWTVNSLTDTNFATLETGGGFGPGTGSGNSGDLRYVLFQAMATGGANTITFPGCTVANPCTIVLGIALPPIFEATANTGATAPANFSLTIDGGAEGAVIIDGNSLGTNISSGALTTNRVFFVDNVAVTLKNLVIQNATAQGGAGWHSGGGGAGFGAGLFVNQSTASALLESVSFLNCAVIGGSGGTGGFGGGGGGLAYPGGSQAGGGVSGAGGSSGSNNLGGSAYAANDAGQANGTGESGGFYENGGAGGGGGGDFGNGGFGGGGGQYRNGGFGGGGGTYGTGGFGGGGGNSGGGGGGVGAITGGMGGPAYVIGGGGAAAGPAIFVVNGSVTLSNVTGSGFSATPGASGGGSATAGTASSAPVFNYAGTVNGSTAKGGLQGTIPVGGSSSTTVYGGTPVGQTSAVQTATVLITTAGTPSAINVLTQGAANLDFKFVSGGTCSTSTAYTVNQLCTVNFTFTPQYPGFRMGAVTLTSGSTVLGTAYISGIGDAPQVAFPQGAQTTFASVNVSTRGLAFDGAGDMFVSVAYNNSSSAVLEYPAAGGGPNTLTTNVHFPYGMEVDGAGNLFIADSYNNRVLELPAGGAASIVSSGLNSPDDVVLDGAGNLFIADLENHRVVEESLGCACQTTVFSKSNTYPAGVAVDGTGNLFFNDGDTTVYELPAGGTLTTLATDLSNPDGMRLDAADDLFVADYFNNRVMEIPPGCTASACQMTFGNGLNQPEAVAVDGADDVYIANGNGNVYKVNRSQPPTLSFATTNVGVTSSAMTVTVQNSGNQPLSFSGFSVGANFKLDSGSTTCSTSTPLASGGTCNVGVDFAPTTGGSLTGTLTITDDTLNAAPATQSVPLSGTGLAMPTINITSVSPSSEYYGQNAAATITATVSWTGNGAAPTASDIAIATTAAGGTLSATTCGNAVSNTITCSATFTPATTALGTYTMSASFSGDGDFAAGSSAQSNNFTITADPVSMTNSTVAVSPSPAVAGSPVSVTVTLKDANGNAINGATAGFSSTSATASFGTPNVNGNVVTVSLTDTVAETAPITITLGGNASGSLNASAQFVAPAFTVVSNADPSTGNGTAANCVDINLPSYSTAANQNCELRDAVAAANALSGVTTNIGFAGSAVGTSGNPAIIQIAQSTPITLTASMNINGPGAGLLTIEGGTTPNSSSNNKVFRMNGGTDTISGVTVANGGFSDFAGGIFQTGGVLTVSNSTFSGNSSRTNGGAIYAYGSSTLRVNNSTFFGNTDPNGGAICADSALTVTDSTFSENTSSNGGAIYAGSTLTVTNSTFSGNVGSYAGGAIWVYSTLTVTNSTFSGNSANNGNGGAIYAYSTLTVSNSTFSGNNANELGGAIYANSTSTLTVSNSTFSGNNVNELGGAIYGGSTLTVTNSTFSGNVGDFGGAIYGGTLTVSNSIFTNDSPSQDPGIYAGRGGTSDHNLFYGGDGFNCSGGACTNTNAVSGNPNLALPGSYGGATQTMLPLPGSAAICTGSAADATAAALTADQRGQALDPNCPAGTVDIGAVQTGYSLTGSFSVPSPVVPNTTLTPQSFTVSEIGGNLPAGNATVTVSDAASDLGTSTTSATNAANGQASFTNLSFAAPETTDTLNATLALNPALTPALALTIASPSFQVGKLTPTVTFTGAPASEAYGTSFNVTTTSTDTGNTPAITGTPGICTVSGNTVTMISGTGACALTATWLADSTYNGATLNQSTTATKIAPTVAFTGAPVTAGYQSGFSVAATTNASTAAVITGTPGVCSVSGSTVTMTTGTGNCSLTATWAADSNYTGASLTQSTTAAKIAPTVTFTGAPSTAPYQSGFTVSATTNASTTASINSSGACSNTGSAVTITTGTGACTLTATWAADNNYNGAALHQYTTATKIAPTVTFTGAPSSAAYNSTFPVATTTTDTGNAPTITGTAGVCTVSGNTVTMTSGTGTCSLTATWAADNNYNGAALQQTTNASQVAQTITITTAAPTSAVYQQSFTVTAGSGASGIAPTFASAGACTNNGATYTMTASSGTCTVTVNQAGNSNYKPATAVTETVTAMKDTPTIQWATPAAITYGTPLSTAQLNAVAIGANGVPVPGTFSYGSTPVATLKVGTLLPAGKNIQLVVVFQATDSTDFVPTFGYVYLTVNQASTTTNATFTTTQTPTGTTATLTTTVSPQFAGTTPTGTVTYSLSVSGNTTTLGTAAVGTAFTTPVLPVGKNTVIAAYSGDSNFTASSTTVYPTGVAPTPVSLSLGSNAVYYPFAAGYTITIPTQSGKALSGTVTVYSGTSAIATLSVPSNGVINAFTQAALPVGTYKLQAVYSGNSVYPPGESPVVTLSIVPLL